MRAHLHEGTGEEAFFRDGVKSLLVIDETDESAGSANIHPANWLIQATGKA